MANWSLFMDNTDCHNQQTESWQACHAACGMWHADSLIVVFIVLLAAVVLVLQPVPIVLASGQHDDVPSIVEVID